MMTQEQQIKCYGQSLESLKEERAELAKNFNTTEMYVASILSDAQETLARGNAEYARQLMNKAKWFLFEQNSDNRKAERAG
jgi:hypothetical protein